MRAGPQEISSDDDEGVEVEASSSQQMDGEDDSIHSFEGHQGVHLVQLSQCSAAFLATLRLKLRAHGNALECKVCPHALRAVGAVLAVAWSPAHSDLVASGGQDDRAFIWRVCLWRAAPTAPCLAAAHPAACIN